METNIQDLTNRMRALTQKWESLILERIDSETVIMKTRTGRRIEVKISQTKGIKTGAFYLRNNILYRCVGEAPGELSSNFPLEVWFINEEDDGIMFFSGLNSENLKTKLEIL